jgi:antagonist of KipI
MAEARGRWQTSNLGEAALLVTLGNGINDNVIGQVHRLRYWFVLRAVRGIRDIVPAYASLLVIFEPSALAEQELRAILEEGMRHVALGDDVPREEGPLHIIPVRYGDEYGPDLASVAEMHSLTPNELVRLHSKRVYKVAFLGFLPGFAYMGRLARRIASPRMPVPRQRVAGGSVGLAGFQTGIYPFASPGGWQIIGRTGVQVWDPTRAKPALFSPGDTVRFVFSRDIPTPEIRTQIVNPPKSPAFEVLDTGGLTTLQDTGREGLAHLGVGIGGAFDASAAWRANALVGNHPGAAVLEMTWTGPTMRALSNITIALDGGDFHCVAGSRPVPLRLSWFVRAGTVLRFTPGPQKTGMRGYLAVAGGFDAPLVLGSRSTSMLAGFGGIGGRALQAGDILGVVDVVAAPVSVAGHIWPPAVDYISHRFNILRFVPFKGRQAALPKAFRAFVTRRWVLTEQADRMGCRFRSEDGGALPVREEELASFGVVRGAIQLPPGGAPVVLGVDHQTTGGYPLLGVVIEADLPILAQLAPGATVRFVPGSVEEARAVHEGEDAKFRRAASVLG